jgi:hypothetical protein
LDAAQSTLEKMISFKKDSDKGTNPLSSAFWKKDSKVVRSKYFFYGCM